MNTTNVEIFDPKETLSCPHMMVDSQENGVCAANWQQWQALIVTGKCLRCPAVEKFQLDWMANYLENEQ